MILVFEVLSKLSGNRELFQSFRELGQVGLELPKDKL